MKDSKRNDTKMIETLDKCVIDQPHKLRSKIIRSKEIRITFPFHTFIRLVELMVHVEKLSNWLCSSLRRRKLSSSRITSRSRHQLTNDFHYIMATSIFMFTLNRWKIAF